MFDKLSEPRTFDIFNGLKNFGLITALQALDLCEKLFYNSVCIRIHDLCGFFYLPMLNIKHVGRFWSVFSKLE